MNEKKKEIIIPLTVVNAKRGTEGACPCGCCGYCCK